MKKPKEPIEPYNPDQDNDQFRWRFFSEEENEWVYCPNEPKECLQCMYGNDEEMIKILPLNLMESGTNYSLADILRVIGEGSGSNVSSEDLVFQVNEVEHLTTISNQKGFDNFVGNRPYKSLFGESEFGSIPELVRSKKIELKVFARCPKKPNPDYAVQKEKFDAELKVYEEKLTKAKTRYEDGLIQYQKDILQYEADMKLWKIEQTKKRIKRDQERLEKMKNEAHNGQ